MKNSHVKLTLLPLKTHRIPRLADKENSEKYLDFSKICNNVFHAILQHIVNYISIKKSKLDGKSGRWTSSWTVIVPNQYWLADFSVEGGLSRWNKQLGLLSIVTNNLHNIIEGVLIIPLTEGILNVFKDRIKIEKELVRQETQAESKAMMSTREKYKFTLLEWNADCISERDGA